MDFALVLSGGTGSRFGSDIPKQYQIIAGKPVLIHTMEQFQRCKRINCIVVTAAQEWETQIIEWSETYGLTKLKAIAPAGPDRQQSIRNGLLAAQPWMTEGPGGVIVQDAVRPLTSPALINRLLQGLEEAPCVLPVIPVTDTVYSSQDGQWVDGLLERSTIYAGQAPEAFRYWEYLRLYLETPVEMLCTMSGSCQLPYSKGWKVKMIPGEQDNFKITYTADLEKCEMLLRKREASQ